MAADDAQPCAVCGTRAKKRCSRCKLTTYCSQDCQRKHWNSGHKTTCNNLKSLSKAAKPPPSTPRPRKGKLPSPRELVAHYESQGMDTQQASLKAIEDLQKVLFRMVTTTSKSKSPNDTTSSKLDSLNSRLLSLDMKVDSKPGYPQTLAIGVAAGALLHSATTLLPTLLGAASKIWSSVSSGTSTG